MNSQAPPTDAGAASIGRRLLSGIPTLLSSLLAVAIALAAGGVVIVEHDKRNVPPEDCGGLILTDRRYYGDTGLSFYRCEQGLVA